MLPMDEEAIIGETAAFSEAWNRADAKAAAAFYTEDGVRVGAYGDIQTGRLEIERTFERPFHQFMPGASVSQDRGTVRLLSADLPIWQAGIVLSHPVDLQSMELSSR